MNTVEGAGLVDYFVMGNLQWCENYEFNLGKVKSLLMKKKSEPTNHSEI